jgi:predicted transcriptional regulator
LCALKKRIGGSNIRITTIKVADEKDMDFVEGLQSLGVNRNVASLITYLKNVKKGPSKDLERFTGLRQPEISTAMRTLSNMGWIFEHEVKSPEKGGGRPLKIYALRATIEEIIEHYETEKNQESTRTIEAIQRLKELSSAL